MAVKKKKKEDKGAPAWMVSYGDMTTLLLTFFITMVSFAEIDGKDFYLVLSSFRGSLGMFTGGYSLSSGRLEELGQNMLNLPSAKAGRALAERLKKAISVFRPEISSKKVRVSENERGLVVTLASDAFFETGSARLQDETRPILKKIGSIVKDISNYVRIEGHTDSNKVTKPKRGRGYESNWELSSARSINILRFLTEEVSIEPKQLSAVAFAEHRPLGTNDTPEGRAYNRRVDIVILKGKGYTESKHKRINRPLPDEEWR